MEEEEPEVSCVGATWRGVKVESIFDLFRELRATVKEEPDVDPPDPPLLSGRRFDPEHQRFLEELSRECKDFDPSRSQAALDKWGHLLQYVEVRKLRHTHDNVSPTFRHGSHGGQSITQLTQDLLQGRVRAYEVTPLVALHWDGKLWVICGNRRLKAVRAYAERQPPASPICVQCIVHKIVRNNPGALIAKFLLAWSTTNQGVDVEVNQRGSRRAQRTPHHGNATAAESRPAGPHPWDVGNSLDVGQSSSASAASAQRFVPDHADRGSASRAQRARTASQGHADTSTFGEAPHPMDVGNGSDIGQSSSASVSAQRVAPDHGDKVTAVDAQPASSAAEDAQGAEAQQSAGGAPTNPAAERFKAACADPPDYEDRPRFTSIPAETDEFYVRYYVGKKGKFGHDFLELEFRPDGRFRDGNNSNYRNEIMIRRECYVSEAVLAELKKMIEDSEILKEDDHLWPAPDRVGRQELEVVCGGEHISFATSKIGSLSDVQASKDPEGLRVFHHLVQDLKTFAFSIVGLHFKIRPA